MKLNDKQFIAVNEPIGNNILVSAAAGSGKTEVLTQRILKILLDKNLDISLSDICIMTFTKKATSEMKERIKREIDKLVAEDFTNEKLKKESALIQNANISTIDSFCKSIVEDNYQKLSEDNNPYGAFDPTYRVADDKEIAIIKDDVINDYLEENYNNPDFDKLFKSFIMKTNDDSFKKIILDCIYRLYSIPFPIDYLDDNIQNFNKKNDDIYSEILNDNLSELGTILRNIDEYRDLFVNFYTDLNEKYEEKLNDKKTKKETIENLGAALEDFTNILKPMFTELTKIDREHINIESIKKLFDIEAIFDGSEIRYPNGRAFPKHTVERDTIKAYVDKLLNKLRDIDETYNVLSNVKYNDIELQLLKVIKDIYINIEKIKNEKNVIEISDFAILTLYILYDKVDGAYVLSDVAKNMFDKYKLVFIDEYQDTSVIQEKILYAITNGFTCKNAFMVGDNKQSIYGFRNAEPANFNTKFNTYVKYDDYNTNDKKDVDIKGINLVLDENYRSSKNIISYVNDLFINIMTANFGDIDYKEDGKLCYHEPTDANDFANRSTSKVEINIIKYEKSKNNKTDENDNAIEDVDNPNESDLEDDNLDLSANEIEAEYVARKIKSKVENNECKYGDIMILLRSDKSKAPIFVNALNKYKIPNYSKQKKGFYNRYEIKFMIDYLNVIDNPIQSIPLVSILTSPIYELKDEEMAFITLVYKDFCGNENNKNGEFYYAIKYFIDTFNISKSETTLQKDISDDEIIEIKNKLVRFINDIEELSFKSRYLSISDLIELIYEKYNIKNYMASMKDGDLRVANLDLFLNNARLYEATSFVGLFNFVRFLEKVVANETEEGIADSNDDYDDVVRIMTIHGSKGLQAPIVFLCGTHSKYNENDCSEKKNCFFDSKYGLSLMYYDLEEKYKYITPKHKFFARYYKNKNYTEETRMLYVALTRAKNELYISAVATRNGSLTLKSIREYENGSYAKDKTISELNSYIDLILKYYSGDSEYVVLNISDFDTDGIEDNSYNKKINLNDIYQYMDATGKFKNDISSLLGTYKKDYKYAELKNIEPKLSVSMIKNEVIEDKKDIDNAEKNFLSGNIDYYDDIESIRDADEENVIKDGTVIGNSYHSFMEKFDYTNINDIDKSNIDDNININDILNFCETDLGKRMKIAYENKKLYREQKFMKLFSFDELKEFGYNKNENLLSEDMKKLKGTIIQGIIDAFFIEKNEKGEDSIVIVDYKTDGLLSKKNINIDDFSDELKEKYEVQLNVYAKCLSEIANLPIKEKYIYSFKIGKEIKI